MMSAACRLRAMPHRRVEHGEELRPRRVIELEQPLVGQFIVGTLMSA